MIIKKVGEKNIYIMYNFKCYRKPFSSKRDSIDLYRKLNRKKY